MYGECVMGEEEKSTKEQGGDIVDTFALDSYVSYFRCGDCFPY
jgi:hypothetical protein